MKKILILFILFIIPINARAYTISRDDPIYVSGQSIGMKIDTPLTISGLYQIKDNGKTYRPWKNKLKENDVILKMNGVEIKTTDEMKKILGGSPNEITLTVLRNNKELEVTLSPVRKTDGTISLGIYVKDHVLGVGTLTFIIPGINIYGSLGHGINVEGSNGEIYPSKVTSIKKSSNGDVGEKNVKIEYNAQGDISKNCQSGIFGSIYEIEDLPMYKIGLRDEVRCGDAYILTCINDELVERFDVKIIDVYKQKAKNVKSMKIKITDERLIDSCGGIVQGMSGSPIIQNDKIIGALTHVLINDTSVGYGIYLEWMLEEMDIFIN